MLAFVDGQIMTGLLMVGLVAVLMLGNIIRQKMKNRRILKQDQENQPPNLKRVA